MGIIYKGIKDRARDWKDSVAAATAAALPAYIRTENTIVGIANGTAGLIDAVDVWASASRRFLLKTGAAAAADKGIYRMVYGGVAGGGGSPWSAVRDDDANRSDLFTTEMAVPVDGGATLGGHTFVLRTANVVLNTTALTFVDAGYAEAMWQRTATTVGLANAGDLVDLSGNLLLSAAHPIIYGRETVSGHQANLVDWDGTNLVLGEATDVMTVNAYAATDVEIHAPLLTTTGDVAIGAAATAGTEILRVTGESVLFDGAVGAVPVSGAGTRLMWCPAKKAFRAGSVTGVTWDDANVGDNSAAFGTSTQAGSNGLAAGNGSVAGNYSSCAIGDSCNASGGYSQSFGYHASSPGNAAFASGWYSRAPLRGQMAMAGTSLTGTAGDSQWSVVSVVGAATDNTPFELTIDGGAASAANRILIDAGKSYDFTVQAVAKCTAGLDAGKQASWLMTGLISNVGGTVALDYAPINLLNTMLFSAAAYTPKGATGGDVNLLAMTLIPTADNTAGHKNLALTFTGHTGGGSSNTWHVVAKVSMTEVA